MQLWRVDADGGVVEYHVIAENADTAIQAIQDQADDDWELEAYEAPPEMPLEIRWDDNPGGLELDEFNCAEMSPREWLQWFKRHVDDEPPFVLCCSEW